MPQKSSTGKVTQNQASMGKNDTKNQASRNKMT